MPSDIILIGPIGAGKSTIGALLAERLELPQCSMDEKRWNYYKEIGYDETLAQHKRETEGFWGIYQYWKPFEAYAVEKLLAAHQNCVNEHVPDGRLNINEHFVRHPSNYKLARFTVYTKDKTPKETCNDILQLAKGG